MDMPTHIIRRLNEDNFDSHELFWSADSRQILLASIHDGQPDIYLLDAQMSITSRLTGDEVSSIHPA